MSASSRAADDSLRRHVSRTIEQTPVVSVHWCTTHQIECGAKTKCQLGAEPQNLLAVGVVARLLLL